MAGVTSSAGATVRHLRDLFGAGSVAVGLDDGQLLARYSATGDASAFEALVARHGPMVLATARAVLRREHDVEDAFQATFLVLARKAGTVRVGDALGGWLHRVALRSAVRASVEARRRAKREGGPPGVLETVAGPVADRPDLDLRVILHEEVDRLPESGRLPVVLCDLEGLTYEEAARRLRWTVPTLRNRLARARRKLRDRLARRGLTGPALALGPLPTVPEALGRAAIAGSPSALALANLILKGIFMTRIKLATAAALASMALTSAGLVAIARMGDHPPAPAQAAPSAGPRAPALDPTPKAEVRGLVVAPDGRPVPGATVRGRWFGGEPGSASATSGPDGRFTLGKVWPIRDGAAVPTEGKTPWLTASAPGFGPGWLSASPREPGPIDLTIKLVEEGPPIEGRILDDDGRPVVGVRASVRMFQAIPGEDLSDWIAASRSPAWSPYQGLVGVEWKAEATTGPDGRFRLAGLGRDRIVPVEISGPAIITTGATAMTREGPDIHWNDAYTNVFHCRSPRFDLAVAPCKPIRGVARDAANGRPIAGLEIYAQIDRSPGPRSPISNSAVTDEQGRYDLTGMPRAPGYALDVRSGRGQPYPPAILRIAAETPGNEPVPGDFVLKRGVVVRGRVTDRATGQPARGQVGVRTFADNPLAGKYPGFDMSQLSSVTLDADGRYELVTIPGRIVMTCRAAKDRYLIGVGAGAIAGLDRVRGDFGNPFGGLEVDFYHVLAEANIHPDAESATVDFQLDPGRSMSLTVLDPEGRPIGQTSATGREDRSLEMAIPEASPSFDVFALVPGRHRRVIVRHRERKLVGMLDLKGDEAGPLTLKLGPWGEVTGKVVARDGRPIAGLVVQDDIGLGQGVNRPRDYGVIPGAWTDARPMTGPDGRFQIEGLVPGLKYGAYGGGGAMASSHLFRDLIVAPGEVKNLGDVRIPPIPKEGRE